MQPSCIAKLLTLRVPKDKKRTEMEHQEEHSIPIWRLAAAAVMLAAGILASKSQCAGDTVCRLLPLWYAAALVIAGCETLRDAAVCIVHRDFFNEITLMAAASVGAFAIGEYPEAVAVLWLYGLGEMLQDRAVDNARDSIKSAMEFRPDHAWVETGADVESRDPQTVAVGDIILVKPGERVPLDGTLLTPEADFDTAALTGEPMPRTIAEDGEVLAGMISIGTVARLRVVRPAAQSAVSRILDMVENAAGRKAPTEQFIRRFARIYTPAVFAMAVLVVVLPWLGSMAGLVSGYSFSVWFARALTFLVIACPCALVISVPLSYFAGIGAASRRGILFKGGNVIDLMADLDTVAFDKTGTLTTGRFAVSRVLGLTEEEVAMAAAMECSSTHPIAVAIVEYAAGKGLKADAPDVRAVAGYGLESDGMLVGAVRLLDKHGVSVPKEIRDCEDTVVAVARGGVYRGCMLLADTLKDDARDAVRLLRRRTVILSGDKQSIVNRVKEAVNADEGYGDLLPEGKAERIEEMQRRHHKVAFVGDGINDAPVLALSDVGIAMGTGGADMAVETADVVIVGDKPSKVAGALAVATRTRRIIAQNITMAIGFKLAFMVLGACGIASIWMAVFADTGVTLLAVLNSMRVFCGNRSGGRRG